MDVYFVMIDLSNNETKIQFSRFLKEMIYRKGLTRERFAAKSNKSLKTITRYLSEDLTKLPKTKINHETYRTLLDAIGSDEKQFKEFLSEQSPVNGDKHEAPTVDITGTTTDIDDCYIAQRLLTNNLSQSHQTVISIEGLVDQLVQNDSSLEDITVICAPPGFGKSFLLRKLANKIWQHTERSCSSYDIHLHYDNFSEVEENTEDYVRVIFLDSYEKIKKNKRCNALNKIEQLNKHKKVIFTCLPEDIDEIQSRLPVQFLYLDTFNFSDIVAYTKQQEQSLNDQALHKDLNALVTQSEYVLDIVSVPYFLEIICQQLKLRRNSPHYVALNNKWLTEQIQNHLLNYSSKETRKHYENSQRLISFRKYQLPAIVHKANIFYKKLTHYGLLRALKEYNSHEFLGSLLLIDLKREQQNVINIIDTTLKAEYSNHENIATIAKAIAFTNQVTLILGLLSTDIREILWKRYLSQAEGCEENIEILHLLDSYFLSNREKNIRRNLKYFNRWRNDELLKLTHKLTNRPQKNKSAQKELNWDNLSVLDTKKQLQHFIDNKSFQPGFNIDINQLELIIGESSHRFNIQLLKTINSTLETYPNHELCDAITRIYFQKITDLMTGDTFFIYTEILKAKVSLVVNPNLRSMYIQLLKKSNIKIKYKTAVAQSLESTELSNKELINISNIVIEHLELSAIKSTEIKLYTTLFSVLTSKSINIADSTLKILKKSNAESYFMLKKQFNTSKKTRPETFQITF